VSAPPVEILAVGSELLVHGRQDTNSAELGDRFTRAGFRVVRRLTVGDDLETLTAAFRDACGRAALVISTGGLGPTGDDRTREAVAGALGLEMRESPQILRSLEGRFRALGRAMPASNRRQAWVPEGAEPLPNPEGTAPGLLIDHGAGWLLVLPGPPVEMRAVLTQELLRRLHDRFQPPAVAVRAVRTSGLPESAVEDRIRDLYEAREGCELTVLASPGEVEIRILSRHPAAERAESAAAELEREVIERLGKAVFSTEDAALTVAVGDLLRQAGLTLAVAESCTAGMLGAELTRPAGSSDYFVGGVLAYSDRVKEMLLGVAPELLQAHGAVSEPVARAMAEGVRQRLGAEVGLAVTGIAGPGGGSPDKPVGLVFEALAVEGRTECWELQLPGSRDRVRRWAVARAMDHLRRFLDRQEPGGA
jgi:nicotinamide-nucleotide amidase